MAGSGISLVGSPRSIVCALWNVLQSIGEGSILQANIGKGVVTWLETLCDKFKYEKVGDCKLTFREIQCTHFLCSRTESLRFIASQASTNNTCGLWTWYYKFQPAISTIYVWGVAYNRWWSSRSLVSLSMQSVDIILEFLWFISFAARPIQWPPHGITL